jgi:hypothetical protein
MGSASAGDIVENIGSSSASLERVMDGPRATDCKLVLTSAAARADNRKMLKIAIAFTTAAFAAGLTAVFGSRDALTHVRRR